ncbi:hypothetical protein GS462_25245 [Rhodococcus hoagii]|nr:hypothetical protein [Prescottella equi]
MSSPLLRQREQTIRRAGRKCGDGDVRRTRRAVGRATAGQSGQPGEHLEHLVDDMEKKVEEERDERGVEGSATDRHRRAPIDTGDEAPD